MSRNEGTIRRFVSLALLVAILLVPGLITFAQSNRIMEQIPRGAKMVPAGLPVVDVPISKIGPGMIAKVSDPALWAEIQRVAGQAAKLRPARTISLGLAPGLRRRAALTIGFAPGAKGVPALLSNQIHTFNPAKPTYSVVDYLVEVPPLGPGLLGNLWRFGEVVNPGKLLAKVPVPPVAPPAPEQYDEGCCGTLTAMHSLVRRMGRKIKMEDVTEQGDTDGDGSNDGLVWKSSALKALWAASGDTGGRGMNAASVAQAHAYDPGDVGAASQTTAGVQPIFDGGEDGVAEGGCGPLKAVADDINKRLADDEDVVMYILFAGGGGHVVDVEGADYTEGPPCLLKITVTRTSRQDGGNNFENIPVNPGTASYNLWSDGSITGSVNTEFPGKTVGALGYSSFGR